LEIICQENNQGRKKGEAMMTTEISEKDVEEVICICKKISKEKIAAGCVAVFYPIEEDKPFYDELVRRGTMKPSPVDPDGYSFSDDLETIMNFKGRETFNEHRN
jgi:hypothetical protein